MRIELELTDKQYDLIQDILKRKINPKATEQTVISKMIDFIGKLRETPKERIKSI